MTKKEKEFYNNNLLSKVASDLTDDICKYKDHSDSIMRYQIYDVCMCFLKEHIQDLQKMNKINTLLPNFNDIDKSIDKTCKTIIFQLNTCYSIITDCHIESIIKEYLYIMLSFMRY